MKKLNEVLENKEDNYILPFFWQHGEDEETLRDYMKNIDEAGIKAVCIESRPHPDYVGAKWWRDMDIIMDEARKRKMKVWVLDDSHFPTGYAVGKIKEEHPELRKWYLNVQRLDFKGPLKDSSFIVKHFAGRAALMPGYKSEDDKLLSVVAAKVCDTETMGIDEKTLVDVSNHVHDGVLYWDLPEGVWSIFVVFETRNGGEEMTKDYLNPIVPEATRVLIDAVYEPHFNRYKDDFGKTLAGFFSDEPRFGNMKGFDGILGTPGMVLPWSDDVLDILQKEVNKDILMYLPLLFVEGKEKTSSIRYAYMNVVSKLYGENFTRQLGNWCREHGVEYIGHVIEDNGAHSRLGYGAGHFFRALAGEDMSGIDVIGGQIVPGMDFKHTGFSSSGWDGEFFHYGLGKLGTSLAHLDPKKKGRTMCELFGAYGWVEGLKFMKWLTDHLLVRGVNNFVPHAFSPKAFPDWDCPPHFYAGGNDAEFKYMKIWSDYTNRISHLLSNGKHIAPAAVLYHAEAEWSGKYMPFEKPVKELMQNQIDCDVIPADIFKDNLLIEGKELKVNHEKFKCLVVPYAEALPEFLLNRIDEALTKGFKVIFIQDIPTKSSENTDVRKVLNSIRKSSNCVVVELNSLAEKVKSFKFNEISLEKYEPNLTYYHYSHEAEDIFMFFNENPYDDIDTKVYIPLKNKAVYYNAFENKTEACKLKEKDAGVELVLKLSAYESKIVVFNKNEAASFEDSNDENEIVKEVKVSGSWKVSMANALEYPSFANEMELSELTNLAVLGLHPNFSGTIRYEINFEVKDTPKKAIIDLGRAYEIADMSLNGEKVGVKICPPYKFEVSNYLKKGTNKLVVEVTNTLVKSQKDLLSSFAVQEPTGLLGPVKVNLY